jgi:hypothetical protein
VTIEDELGSLVFYLWVVVASLLDEGASRLLFDVPSAADVLSEFEILVVALLAE